MTASFKLNDDAVVGEEEESLVSSVNVDELECLLANLIDKGYMKGYLAHEKQFVVLSKADPFPALLSIKL
jgi:hypothetical protein